MSSDTQVGNCFNGFVTFDPMALDQHSFNLKNISGHVHAVIEYLDYIANFLFSYIPSESLFITFKWKLVKVKLPFWTVVIAHIFQNGLKVLKLLKVPKPLTLETKETDDTTLRLASYLERIPLRSLKAPKTLTYIRTWLGAKKRCPSELFFSQGFVLRLVKKA